MGSVALAFFIYGGFVWIMSGGNSEKVQKGKTVITNAVIGIAIILLSGIMIRYTSEALTGQRGGLCTVEDRKFGRCVAFVGGTCEKVVYRGGNLVSPGALWLSIPAGFTDAAAPRTSSVPEELKCVKKDGTKATCKSLNAVLKQRFRPEAGSYKCVKVTGDNVGSCVRGLCPTLPSEVACCRSSKDATTTPKK